MGVKYNRHVASAAKFLLSDDTETGRLPSQNSDIGAVADSAVTNPASSGSVIGLLKGLLTKLGSVVLAAGSAVVGKVGIDQTTPGTTNGVQINAALPTGTNVIGKVGIDQTTDEVTNNIQVKAESAYATTALAASGVIKNAAGTLYGISGLNNKTSDQYIQIFNTAAVPADGAAPFALIKVGAGCNFSYDFGIRGMRLTTGICWSNSSTLATKTIGAADCWLVASYK
jgi:hypothetical protein